MRVLVIGKFVFQAYTLVNLMKRVTMSKHVTILTSSNHIPLVKIFNSSDLKQQSFVISKEFNVIEEPVSDLQSLSRLLQRLETEATQTIIRGSLTTDQANPVPRNKETFTATPRQWCMIDIDSLAWDGDIYDQKAMLLYAIQQLPIEFQSVYFWYHFSSSMGIKVGVRVHLWFWLERPCSDHASSSIVIHPNERVSDIQSKFR